MWARTVPLSNCWSPQSLTPGSLWNHEGTEANAQSPVRTASPYLLNHRVCNVWTAPVTGQQLWRLQCHVLHATVKLKAARAQDGPIREGGRGFYLV